MDNDYIGSPKEFYASQIYFNHRREKEITDMLHSYNSDEYRRSLVHEWDNLKHDWHYLRRHKHKYFFNNKVMHKRKYYESLYTNILKHSR